jgi:hypothetical protein
MKRGLALFFLSALLFVAFASAVRAGGWAVVTLDALPQNVVAGQPIPIGMTIRQHGRTLWKFDDVRVRGYYATGETFETRAVMDTVGHYTATLNFPRAGKWRWAVASGLAPEWQTMPDLQVADAAQAETIFANAKAQENAPLWTHALSSVLLRLALGIIGFVGSASGLVLWRRARVHRQTFSA